MKMNQSQEKQDGEQFCVLNIISLRPEKLCYQNNFVCV